MIDRVPVIKYYAERSKGNIFLPVSVTNGQFIELVWPTLAISPRVESPDNIKVSVIVEVGDEKKLYALAASPNVTWKAIFQEPTRLLETDPEFVVELDPALAVHVGGDSVTAKMMRRGRAQIYFYDKYKKNYYGGYFLVDFRILPVGPLDLYVDAANGSPQSVTLTCYGYPGVSENWRISGGLKAYKICDPSPQFTTTSDLTGTGTIDGKNSSVIFTAKKKGTITVEYFDSGNRKAKNSVIIKVLDGEDP